MFENVTLASVLVRFTVQLSIKPTNMDSYVLFKGTKRLTLKEEDMTTEKINRIFQVHCTSLHITDDSNVAIFPGNDGRFSTLEESSSMPASYNPTRFSFHRPQSAAGASTSSARPSPRVTVAKTCQRMVWKQNARKVLAVREEDFLQLQFICGSYCTSLDYCVECAVAMATQLRLLSQPGRDCGRAAESFQGHCNPPTLNAPPPVQTEVTCAACSGCRNRSVDSPKPTTPPSGHLCCVMSEVCCISV
ncbi:putative LOC107386333-like protein [Nothobranchius furzeri]|uniref:LOC107386333-like protein n=1 Tax=Nothobranchius furzeri TaxID=105023 RepID=A0A9D2XNQ1_NOTFU|nr:putative LOC107386333-like protein [Nothobranchius furzeri]